MMAFLRVLGMTLGVGLAAFLVGFVGPMIWAQDANQGPMLGIFITGPLGVLAGFVYGIWREKRRGRGD